MKKFRKVLALTLCAAALVGASVMGTMAYLTDNDEVTNTFTVGNVDITLDEAKVDGDGKAITGDGAERVDSNEYHLLPGGEYDKDPTVTVIEGSENAYVRMLVKVTNYSNLKAAFPKEKYTTLYNNDDFLLQHLVNGWDADTWKSTGKISVENDIATYEFRYNGKVSGPTDNNDNNVNGTALDSLFDTIVIPGTVNNTELANLKNVQIKVEAHAIQADGFTAKDGKTAEDVAWEAFDGQNK